jgi:CRP-like cAMP-binding protein
MMTVAPLLKYVTNKHQLDESDIVHITKSFKFEYFAKGAILEEENVLAKKLYFIVSGFAMALSNNDGEEVITQIVGANNFITGFDSFAYGTASNVAIKCITNCEVLSITRLDYDNLNKQSSNWGSFCRHVYENVISFNQQRIKDLLILSANERYLKLLAQQPELILNVPIQYIASYIGIKPESLSRIRRKMIS